MSTMLEMPTNVEQGKVRARHDPIVGQVVRYLLANQVQRFHSERRREQRFPFPYPIRLTCVSPDGEISPAESVVVLGKHLSEHGFDFYSKEPLPYRRAVATFDRADGRQPLYLLMELNWCRFGRHGWYENGGRFLQVLTTNFPHVSSCQDT
jgi:hypothetical protein